MNRIYLLFVLLCAIPLAIYVSGCFNRLCGNGKVITENRPAKSFTKLEVNGIFKTVITQDGGPEFVKVETDENLQKTISVINEGESLIVCNADGMRFYNPTRMIFYVNIGSHLNSLANKSVGNLETQGKIKLAALYLKTDAVGKTVLNLEADSLKAEINSVGSVHLEGMVEFADISNNSVGKLEAFGLKAQVLRIKDNSVGAVEIFAEKEMYIDHNGVGKLEYRGDAVVKSLNSTGVGKVFKGD